MLESLFIHNIWVTVLAWDVLYISDYYLTLYSASLYHQHAKQFIVFTGSYELTPQFQSDIDNLRKISPIFLRYLALSTLAIIVMWVLLVNVLELYALYVFVLGALILSEAAIHIRHFRNLTLFHLAKAPGSLDGQITYSLRTTLTISSLELVSFTFLYLLIYGVTGSAFVLGGALRCVTIALSHQRMAGKAATETASQPAISTPDVQSKI